MRLVFHAPKAHRHLCRCAGRLDLGHAAGRAGCRMPESRGCRVRGGAPAVWWRGTVGRRGAAVQSAVVVPRYGRPSWCRGTGRMFWGDVGAGCFRPDLRAGCPCLDARHELCIAERTPDFGRRVRTPGVPRGRRDGESARSLSARRTRRWRRHLRIRRTADPSRGGRCQWRSARLRRRMMKPRRAGLTASRTAGGEAGGAVFTAISG